MTITERAMYTAVAEADKHVWNVRIDGLPEGRVAYTRAPDFDAIEERARACVAAALGVDADSFDLAITWA